MKFRVLFILFNIVILAAFAIIVFMPLVVLGADYSRVFWSGNWPVAIVFVVVLAGLNAYFGMNWRLFQLLEREDWPQLISYTENTIFGQKRISRQRVRILVNAYVVTGSSSRIAELERFFREKAPVWVPRFAPELSIGYLLTNDPAGLEEFSRELKDNSKCVEPHWIRWTHAFSLLLQKKPAEAGSALAGIAGEPMPGFLQLLTAYLLDSIAGSEQDETAQGLRETFTRRYTPERWKRELDRQSSNLQVLVLSELITNAASWAFDGGGSTGE